MSLFLCYRPQYYYTTADHDLICGTWHPSTQRMVNWSWAANMDTIWQIPLNDHKTSGPKCDIHSKLHGYLTCRFDVIVSALLQDY